MNPSNGANGLTSDLWNVVRYVVIEQIMIGDLNPVSAYSAHVVKFKTIIECLFLSTDEIISLVK